MAENSKIEWCHHTFNPWIGCTKVSEGCAHCYAEKSSPANVMRANGHETWGKGAMRSRTSAANWKEPLKWDREAAACRLLNDGPWKRIATVPKEGRILMAKLDGVAGGSMTCEEWDALPHFRPRVFCASLADWLDDEVPIEWLAELLELIMRTPHLDWLLLTKRPQNFRPRLESVLKQFPRNCLTEDEAMLRVRIEIMLAGWSSMKHTHPKLGCENYWIGTTVENQARADERIPQLLSIPAKVRFLSCEPLLGPVDTTTPLLAAKYKACEGRAADIMSGSLPEFPWLDWVICGGESGPKARPMHPDWARSLREQCSAAGVAFFFKQWGDWLYTPGDPGSDVEWTVTRVGKKKAGRVLDGRTHDEFPKVERGRGA